MLCQLYLSYCFKKYFKKKSAHKSLSGSCGLSGLGSIVWCGKAYSLWKPPWCPFSSLLNRSSFYIHSRWMTHVLGLWRSFEIRSEYSASLRLLDVGSCTSLCLWIDSRYKEQAHCPHCLCENELSFLGWVGDRKLFFLLKCNEFHSQVVYGCFNVHIDISLRTSHMF